MIEDMLDCIDEIWSFNGYEDIKKVWNVRTIAIKVTSGQLLGVRC